MSAPIIEPRTEAPAYYLPREVARYFRVDYWTVMGWRWRGVPCQTAPDGRLFLRMERIGGQWRIPVAAWEEFWLALNPGQELPELRSAGEGTSAEQLAREQAKHRNDAELGEYRPRGRKG